MSAQRRRRLMVCGRCGWRGPVETFAATRPPRCHTCYHDAVIVAARQ
ncbi:MAG TPA: hypothetical protein VMU34_15575 [Mycobacterium sp.]|nr:hypothetical protein [Mycobacterium sp.]